jgi:hypothetical protein
MAFLPINFQQSSNIRGASYDSETLTLRIDFQHGGTYEYKQVPEDVVNEFSLAESAGKYLHAYIKGSYEHSKVG